MISKALPNGYFALKSCQTFQRELMCQQSAFQLLWLFGGTFVLNLSFL